MREGRELCLPLANDVSVTAVGQGSRWRNRGGPTVPRPRRVPLEAHVRVLLLLVSSRIPSYEEPLILSCPNIQE